MLAFNVGAFVVEYAVIVAQVRLLAEVKDQADRMRAGAVNPRLATRNPDATVPGG
jgi:hypothetical protein